MILRFVLLSTLLLILKSEDSEAEETFTIMSMANRFPSASTPLVQEASDGSKVEAQQRFERMMGRPGKKRRKNKMRWNKVIKPSNYNEIMRQGQGHKSAKPKSAKMDPPVPVLKKALEDPARLLEEKKKYVRALIDVFTDLVMEVIENK